MNSKKIICAATLGALMIAGLDSCSDSAVLNESSHTLDVQVSQSEAYCLDSASALLVGSGLAFTTQVESQTDGHVIHVTLGQAYSDSGTVSVQFFCGGLNMGTHVYTYGNGSADEVDASAVPADSAALLLSKTIQAYTLPSDSANLFLAVAYAMIDSQVDLRSVYGSLDLGSLDSALAAIGLRKQTPLATLTSLGVSMETIAMVGDALVSEGVITADQLSNYLAGTVSSSSLSSPSSSSVSDNSSSSTPVSSSSLSSLETDTAGLASIINAVQAGNQELFFSKIEFRTGIKMARFELTQAQSGNDTILTTSGSPESKLNFYEAILFCNSLSKAKFNDTLYAYDAQVKADDTTTWLQNLTLRSGIEGYRLPTSSEWIAAYYYGLEITQGFYWSTGLLSEYANIGYDCTIDACPVGSRKPNLMGLFDMTGNVAEWVMNDNETQLTSTTPSNMAQLFPLAGVQDNTEAEPYVKRVIGLNQKINRGVRLVWVTP